MDFRKHAFVLAIVECLKKHSSWTGKTHVQKSLSLLRDKGDVEVPFRFVLYKHGPYSFEVTSALEEMRSYAAIEVAPVRGFGVVISSGPMANWIKERARLEKAECDAIEKVCTFVNSRNVSDLERLATASWIRAQEGLEARESVVDRLLALKPHIDRQDAERADTEVSTWLSRQA